MGLHSRRPVRVPMLTPVHRRKRQQWTREHQNWTTEQWKKVAWSNEFFYITWMACLWTTRGKAKCYEPGSEWIECIKSKVDQKKMSKQTSDPTVAPCQNKKQKNGKGCKQKKLI
ncbi:Transposable element Tcb1 transposase [Anabarilius grahami]|uniref:Transposable element Tcb1 transposase n=1 Tax=Anabarilius grahami TaxID=495550 RepID=A0A3N0Y605_ANAGA|nr:Transposable element Tcb1 transposase [Anabarilius grahami]